MLELNQQSIARAAERTREHHPQVSRITDTHIAVTCANPEHPEGHVARFERRADSSLWGECYLRDTGEACPSAIGHRICYHLTAGVTLFLALEWMRAQADPDGETERAVMFGGALPQAAAKIAGRFRETVREIKTVGRTVFDRRVGGIQI